MSKIIFITGTCTGVGKTYVSCLLLEQLVRKGIDVRTIKLIETGCSHDESGNLYASDAGLLFKAAGGRGCADDVVLRKYKTPVAPAMAMKLEGDMLTAGEIEEFVIKASENCDVLVFEGAGGLLVPVVETYTYADLLVSLQKQRLDVETVFVAGSKLGVINHSSLTMEVLRSRGIVSHGYVFNDLYAGSQSQLSEDASLNSNRELLSDISKHYGFSELAYIPADADKAGSSPHMDELLNRVLSQ